MTRVHRSTVARGRGLLYSRRSGERQYVHLQRRLLLLDQRLRNLSARFNSKVSLMYVFFIYVFRTDSDTLLSVGIHMHNYARRARLAWAGENVLVSHKPSARSNQRTLP